MGVANQAICYLFGANPTQTLEEGWLRGHRCSIDRGRGGLVPLLRLEEVRAGA